MKRKSKILAFFLAVFLIVPVLAVDISAAPIGEDGLTDAQRTARNAVAAAVAVDYITETVWVAPDNTALLAQSNITTPIVTRVGSPATPSVTTTVASDMVRAAAAASATRGGAPQFMYTVRAVTTGQRTAFLNRPQGGQLRLINALARERWFPIHGGGFDITRVVPTNVNRDFYIAIRCANDVFDNSVGFPTRVAFRLSPRYNIRLNRDLVYDAANERIMLTGNSQTPVGTSVIYQFDMFPQSAPLALDRLPSTPTAGLTGIEVPADIFTMRTIVNITSAPQFIPNDPATGTFWARGRNVRFTIPARPAAPNAGVNEAQRRITNLRRTAGWEFTLDDPDAPGDTRWVARHWSEGTINLGRDAQDFSSNSTAIAGTFGDAATFGLHGFFQMGAPAYNRPLIDDPASTFNRAVDRSDGTGDPEWVYRVWIRATHTARAPASEAAMLEIPAEWFMSPAALNP
jgi:hypothetical protein